MRRSRRHAINELHRRMKLMNRIDRFHRKLHLTFTTASTCRQTPVSFADIKAAVEKVKGADPLRYRNYYAPVILKASRPIIVIDTVV